MSQENTAPVSEESTPEDSASEVLDSIDQGNGEAHVDEGTEDSIDAAEATDDELAEVVDSDDATEEEKAEAEQELHKRLKLKIYGQETEFDLGNDDHIERLKELAQKGEGADQKFQKASEIEKNMRRFAELIQKDPLKALEAAGHNLDELADSHMQKRIADMEKSPEQKRLEELEAMVEQERQKNEELERTRQEAEQSRAQEEYSRQLDDEITGALEDSDLPKSAYVVKRIAENLMLAMDQGYEDVTVDQILPIVQDQIHGEIRQMFEAMPEDVIEKTLGNSVSDKLRKRRISRQRKTQTKAAHVKATGKSEINRSKAEKTAKPLAAKDFWKNF